MNEKAIPAQYAVLRREFLPDIGSEAILLRHKKSGARVLLMPNEDDNKVFYIGFRTPPRDSTGVAHIIEHTVLNGSRDFPVKDPFRELAKGSLNTFLNAMTYPDKTVYPVASCNEKDFANLCHVYLDAVFHPNIYQERRIFEQEGWHYEHDERGRLTVNGVVFNEMKGAMSSPDDVLENAVYASLFPDTTYAMVSGGDPAVIPSLTYEAYLDFHRRYYHPSNSFLFLYGNLDMNERLSWMDRQYLSQYNAQPVDSRIAAQPAFRTPASADVPYSLMPEEDPADKTFYAYSVVLPGRDARLDAAFRVLDYVLCDAEGAPLRRALEEAGIGEDVSSLYENGVNQPVWTLTAKYAAAGQQKAFEEVVRGALQEIADRGFDRDALLAGINYHEFRYREADFGSYPKGLIFGLSALDSWLYDENAPWLYLTEGRIYEELRDAAASGYFESLIRTWYLDNPHRSMVTLHPEPGRQERMEREAAEKLSALEASMSPAEKEQISEEELRLRQYHDTPDDPEMIRRIPLLERSDLRQQALPFRNETKKLTPDGECILLCHPVFTGGINYVTLCFDIRRIPQRFYPYLVVLRTVFSALSTKRHSYAALNSQINIHTGGISASVVTYASEENPEQYRFQFEVSVRMLQKNLPEAFSLLREILTETDYTDTKRIRRLLEEERSAMRQDLPMSGHATALTRAQAHFLETGVIQDDMNGIGAYRFLCRILDSGEISLKEVTETLQEMAGWIFAPERLTLVDTTAAGEDCEAAAPQAAALRASLAAARERIWEENGPVCAGKDEAPFRVRLRTGREAFTTAGGVQYVCEAGDYLRQGLPFHGALRVLRVILGYDYLWIRLRDQGGAYGCMGGFTREGCGYFVTFRDPHLGRTLRVFDGVPEAVRRFGADDRTMTQYVIGAVSAMDLPMTPSAFGRYSMSCYLSGVSMDRIQQYRNEVLACTQEDIRALADYADATLQSSALVVIGSPEKIREHRERFDRVEALL